MLALFVFVIALSEAVVALDADVLEFVSGGALACRDEYLSDVVIDVAFAFEFVERGTRATVDASRLLACDAMECPLVYDASLGAFSGHDHALVAVDGCSVVTEIDKCVGVARRDVVLASVFGGFLYGDHLLGDADALLARPGRTCDVLAGIDRGVRVRDAISVFEVLSLWARGGRGGGGVCV